MKNAIDWSKLSELEKIKFDSNYLRGTIEKSLSDPLTGGIAHEDTQLIKFHGMYQQFDRDLEKERKKQKLEPAYSFLLRVRMPGGRVTPEQWLKLDAISEEYGNSTLKVTTRQTFQLHGVLKKNLKKTIQEINRGLLDTIAACGDVNRNVMSHANPAVSALHAQVIAKAGEISEHLLPSSNAYHEIWLGKKLVAGGKKEIEPIYGDRYLPRKFKIGVVIPPDNDCDIYSQDLGFIAIVKKNEIVKYNVIAGGGLGSTFGVKEAYPRTGTLIGSCNPEDVVDVAEKIILVQRENGDRQDRKQARLKYTIDRMGINWFKGEVEKLLGYKLSKTEPFVLEQNGDVYGWKKGADGRWHYTGFVEGGRIKDSHNHKMKTALREIAKISDGAFILTGNQNVIFAGVSGRVKSKIDQILRDFGVFTDELSGIRKNSIACTALPTCPLANAEAERYLPVLITKLELILKKHHLEKEDIVIRMTGCPNGCGRPYLAEIGLTGKSPGYYNLYLGGSFNGSRLNNLYRETLSEQEILDALEPIIADYAKSRMEKERFGDFVLRRKYVERIDEGKQFIH